ncbi:MAG: nuclear transport factor 2 family protein [Planctomycetaceae bacterium]|nr:nuclear transport factor 2 family protein [Planctomycetaceae bacterium]
MTLQFPAPVAGYFAADKTDIDELVRCFADDAVVRDEGRTYNGLAAIRKWKEGTSTKYQYTSEPLACTEAAGRVVVTSRLTGNFPGSPIDLRFFFKLAGDRIASLEITS